MTLTIDIIADEIAAACQPWSASCVPASVCRSSTCTATRPSTLCSGVQGIPPTAGRTLALVQRADRPAPRSATSSRPRDRCCAPKTAPPLVTIVADEVGNHDTIAGACSKESNTLRYGHHRAPARLRGRTSWRGGPLGHGQTRHRLNVNFFANVPVEADGTLGIVDGLSAPGKSLAGQTDTDTLVLVSTGVNTADPRRCGW